MEHLADHYGQIESYLLKSMIWIDQPHFSSTACAHHNEEIVIRDSLSKMITVPY